MLVKIGFTVLAVFVLLTLVSRLRALSVKSEKKPPVMARCADCGRPVIGTTPCVCQKDRA